VGTETAIKRCDIVLNSENGKAEEIQNLQDFNSRSQLIRKSKTTIYSYLFSMPFDVIVETVPAEYQIWCVIRI
jgi:hypothetical protein